MMKAISILGFLITLIVSFFTFLICASSHGIEESFRHNMSLISLTLAIVTSILFVLTEYLNHEFQNISIDKLILIVLSILIGVLYDYFEPYTLLIAHYALYPKDFETISMIARLLDIIVFSAIVLKISFVTRRIVIDIFLNRE